MQKVRNAQYVAAGVQASDMRMHVRGNVTLPDAEAGRYYGADRQPYRASSTVKRPRFTGEISLRAAAVFLCALFMVFGFVIVFKSMERSDLSKNITALNTAIEATRSDNAILAEEVKEARSFRRISDLASSQYNMVDSKHAATRRVKAPSTRPLEKENNVQADHSPHSVLDGVMTGSR